MDQKPSLGRIVHYRPYAHEQSASGNGNRADILPAVIVAVWNDELVNLKVLADAPQDYWATARVGGSMPVQRAGHRGR